MMAARASLRRTAGALPRCAMLVKEFCPSMQSNAEMKCMS